MSNHYGIETVFDGTPEAAEQAVTAALRAAGFGVLTRIDVAATLKEKIGLDRPPYVILGACNPRVAAEAIEIESDLGLLLPCNVVVRVDGQGRTLVSAIDPVAMLGIVGNPELDRHADEIRRRLAEAIAHVGIGPGQ